MDQAHELTQNIIESTIRAIQECTPARTEMQVRLQHCCEAFDAGDDNAELEGVGEVAARLGEFANFAAHIYEVAEVCCDEADVARLNDECQRLSDCLRQLNDLLQDRDLVALCDIIRFDLSECIGDLFNSLDRLVPSLQRSLATLQTPVEQT